MCGQLGTRLTNGLLIGAASTALVVGLAELVAFGPPHHTRLASCAAPALPGSVVDVIFTDGGAMMGPGMHGGPMMGGPMMHRPGMGMPMMSLGVSPVSVPAGQVSLLAVNRGGLAHEVVVLPLAGGKAPGQRPVGADGEVDEAGAVGEAAQTCGAGEGEGIAPGAAGWTTLTLAPGRYELLCNIAGHYGWGMYAELDVTQA